MSICRVSRARPSYCAHPIGTLNLQEWIADAQCSERLKGAGLLQVVECDFEVNFNIFGEKVMGFSISPLVIVLFLVVIVC